MDVRIASENDKEKWNLFVDREGGSFFQYFDWKYIYEFNTSKHRFIPLIIENNSSEIVGIFPIEENLTSLYGSLMSLPLGASDGFLIKDNSSEEEKKIIIQSFLDYIDVNYSGSHSLLNLREHLPLSEKSINPSQILIDNGYKWVNNAATGLPCTHILKLERPFEEKIWPSIGTKRMKKQIELLKKNSINVIIDDEFEYLNDFVEMEIQTVKKFGVIENREIYAEIFKIFKKKIKLFVCLLDKKPISAALCYYTPTTAYMPVVPYYPIAIDYLTNTLPICASIQYACESGYQYYEMGITTTPSLAFYKEKLGGRRIPMLIYQKEFSHFKMIANNAFSCMVSFGRKYVKKQ
jgi:hypothetical protein